MGENIFPFELFIKNDKGKELFIDTVEKVLSENLQCKDSFGCSILNCHTHVGSKKHLSAFVEAELLFHNSYYNKGFAFCTVELLKNKIADNFSQIILVGYETFGELYICETVEMLRNKLGRSVEYCILETIGDTFRVRASTESKNFIDQAYYIFVVPINTTLTTHDKLMNCFFKWMNRDCTMTDSNNSINIALIVIASKQNNDFWKIDDEEKRILRLEAQKKKELHNIGEREIYYFAKIDGEWFNAEQCGLCFPDLDGKKLTEEQAIFEVNRASVVPMLQLGTEMMPEPFDEKEKLNEENNILKLLVLNRYLIHHHIIRNENHYQYYFDTQRFFQDTKNNGMDLGLEKWLCNEVKKNLACDHLNDKIIYNFIVAPRHYSNAGFVQYVNDVVFGGIARILYFDVTKEYRGNIKAKYSDLTRLVDNIINSRQPSELRFHYVDDMILSGTNYIRTKNLLNTLIPLDVESRHCSRVLFKSVIVLVGRNSNDSKKWYAGDKGNFFEYTHLSISPMRNHEDACSLCKLVKIYHKLGRFCGTNEMAILTNETIKEHTGVKVTEVPESTNQKEKQARVIVRHLLSKRLNNQWWIGKENYVVNRESSEDIYNIIKKLYNDLYRALLELVDTKGYLTGFSNEELIQYDGTDVKVALIKVISRPFFCYHIRQKQAALKFCLESLDKELIEIYTVKKISKSKKRIIKALVNAVADLNAMYLIRAETINKMMYLIRTKEALDFSDYCKAVKRSVGGASDDSKCVLLEYILVTGKEEGFFNDGKQKGILSNIKKEDRYALYLENNNVLIDGFRDIIDNDLGFDNLELVPYYLEKFIKIFEINMQNELGQIKNIIETYKDIFHHLKVQGSNWDTLKYVARKVNELFGEISIKMFFWDKNDPIVYDGYYLLDEGENAEFYARGNLKKIEETLKREPLCDTVYIYENMCIIKISKCLEDYEEGAEEKKREIYFLFEYKGNEISQEEWFKIKILLTLRNRFVHMLGDMNVQNEMNKLNTERKKKALKIKKAHTHYTLEYFEGVIDIFSNYKMLRERNARNDLEDVQWESAIEKQFYDNYIMFLTSEFTSEIYRMVIYYPGQVSYKGVRLCGRLAECLQESGFTKNNESLCYKILVPNECDCKVMVIINCDINSFQGKKFWFFRRGEALIPYYFYLIMTFAMNAGYHFQGKGECELVVKADGDYIIFDNNVSNNLLSEDEMNKILSEARKKMETPPWEFRDEMQSITLWSFFRYFQILEKEISRIPISDRGRKCPKERCAGDGVQLAVQNNRFIIKLKLLEEIEREG